MSTSALWSWWSEGRGTSFGAEDAAAIEQDYLLHVFWGDDPEQKTETGWCKLSGDRLVDFARMRQLRPDAVGMFDSVRRSTNTPDPNAVVSEGRYQTAELQIRTEGPAAPLVSPQHLVAACISGNAHDVRMLLLQFTEFANAIVDEKSQATGTPPRRIASAEARPLLLAQNRPQLTCRGLSRRAVLHVAASAGHLAVVHCLTACGAGIEARTTGGATPMHAAAKSGALAVVKFLASVGASTDAKTAAGAVPLHIASQHGHGPVVEYLIEERRSDPNVTNDAGVTPLLLACETGHTSVLLQLVAAGAHVNRPDSDGVTPVLAASHFGHAEAVYALLTAGAEYEPVNVNAVSQDGLGPLFAAAQRGSIEIVKLLLSAGAAHDSTYGEGDSAFSAAEAAQFNSHEQLAEMLTDGSLLSEDQLLAQLAGMGDGSSDDESAGPKYCVTKKVAVNRNFEDTGSTNRVGWLDEGMIVSAMETRGLGSAELRIRFEHETVNGWANVQRADGTVLLQRMDDGAQTLEQLYSGQASTLSLVPSDSFESSSRQRLDSRAGSQVSSLSISPRTFAATGSAFSTGDHPGSSLDLSQRRASDAGGGPAAAAEMTPDDFGSPRATALGSYRALSKLVVRQSRESNSKKKGSLAAGTVIKALEITDVTNTKGVTETRLLFSGGWVSMQAKDGSPALQEVESLQPWETPVAERRFGSGNNGSSSSTAWRQPSGSSVGVPTLRAAGGGSMEQQRRPPGRRGSSTRSASDSGFTVASTSTERTGSSRIGSSRIGSTTSSVSSDSRRPSTASLSSDSGMPPTASPSVSPSYGRRNSAGTAHVGYRGGGGGLGEIPRSHAPQAVSAQPGGYRCVP